MITHRGPDFQGVWTSHDGHVGKVATILITQQADPVTELHRTGLGHCRLAINDLSPEGCQPFHTPDNKVHAVVNGELYDSDRIREDIAARCAYPFKGHSDCEIVTVSTPNLITMIVSDVQSTILCKERAFYQMKLCVKGLKDRGFGYLMTQIILVTRLLLNAPAGLVPIRRPLLHQQAPRRIRTLSLRRDSTTIRCSTRPLWH